MPIKDQLFLASQYLAPHHLVSRLFGYASDCREPAVKNWMISRFVQRYGVDMSEAEQEDALAYDCFNDFFTRALKDGARRWTTNPARCCVRPTARSARWAPSSMAASSRPRATATDWPTCWAATPARAFQGGEFATIYLSPRDYHQVHMPVAGTLREMVHVPGRLFSVNPLTARNVPRLFARNERVVCIFDTEHGPMALVLVGAMIVASIETVWAGLVTPHKRGVKATRYDADARAPIHLDKGAEMGRFKLGSTAIVLFGPDKIRWSDTPSVRGPVRMGELLALPA